MNIKGFDLVNAEKVERALQGNLNREGELTGGVRIADGSFDEDALLAEYDRLGGLITRNGDSVKTGSFYDFRAKKPRAEAQVVFVYRVNSKEIEVADGEQLPGIVKASKVLKEEVEEVVAKKARKGKKSDE